MIHGDVVCSFFALMVHTCFLLLLGWLVVSGGFCRLFGYVCDFLYQVDRCEVEVGVVVSFYPSDIQAELCLIRSSYYYSNR